VVLSTLCRLPDYADMWALARVGGGDLA